MKFIKITMMSLALLFVLLGCTQDVKDTTGNTPANIDVNTSSSSSDDSTPNSHVSSGTQTLGNDENTNTPEVTHDDSTPSSSSSSGTQTSGNEENTSIPEVTHSRLSNVPQEEEDEEEAIEPEVIPSNWYLRLVADDTNRGLKTNIAQLGVVDADETKFTLLSTGHFGGTYLDIVFINPIDIAAGIYKTQYQHYQDNTTYRWQFTVRSDDTNADVTLSWHGLFALTPYIDGQNRTQYREYRSMTNPLVKQMKLVDVDLGTEIAVSEDGHVKSYMFNMDGKNERVFEWVVETDIVNIVPKQVATSLVKSKSLKINFIKNPKSKVINLSKPPTMEWDNEK